jgi:hypothetical protein
LTQPRTDLSPTYRRTELAPAPRRIILGHWYLSGTARPDVAPEPPRAQAEDRPCR